MPLPSLIEDRRRHKLISSRNIVTGKTTTYRYSVLLMSYGPFNQFMINQKKSSKRISIKQ